MSINVESSQSIFTLPVASYQYPETIRKDVAEATAEEPKEPEVVLTEKSFLARLAIERSTGFAEAEARLRQEFERSSEVQISRIAKRIEQFEASQRDYFTRVETEIVQLALSIAAKILHREAQVDPMLLGAIVHFALGQIKEGSIVSLSVQPHEVGKWQEYFTRQSLRMNIAVIEDADLEDGDCILKTELGTVNLNLDQQLKEIERGFFDILAKKPAI